MHYFKYLGLFKVCLCVSVHFSPSLVNQLKCIMILKFLKFWLAIIGKSLPRIDFRRRLEFYFLIECHNDYVQPHNGTNANRSYETYKFISDQNNKKKIKSGWSFPCYPILKICRVYFKLSSL